MKAPPAAAAAARATGKAGPAPKAAGSSDDDEGGKGGKGGDEAPPPPKALRSALAKLKGGSCPKALRLSNCGLHDVSLTGPEPYRLKQTPGKVCNSHV